MQLAGGAFSGENLDILYTVNGKGVVTDVAAASVTNIETRGLWAQAAVTPVAGYTFLLGAGQEDPRDGTLPPGELEPDPAQHPVLDGRAREPHVEVAHRLRGDALRDRDGDGGREGYLHREPVRALDAARALIQGDGGVPSRRRPGRVPSAPSAAYRLR